MAERRKSTVTLLRFDAVQRTAHWTNALLFGILMFTAIPLYFGSFFGIVFQRHVIEEIHLWTGLMLPVPLAASAVGPWGRRLREDFRRFRFWTRPEILWMKTLGRSKLDADKYNPGQKANALFVTGAIAIMFVTGYILQWFRFFPVSWRTGATITHDFFAFAIFAVVVGHVVMAVTHRDALVSMFRGTVSEEWAA
ncbi:MAG: cytochrome b/b6 domain-containing protein, partial [Acidimicrobiales bacterium]